MEPVIPAFISALFIGLTFALFGLIIYGLSAALRKINPEKPSNLRITGIVALIMIAWLAATKLIASNHILDQWNSLPPRLLIILLPPLIVTIALAFSKKFGKFLENVPQQWLTFIQSFRIIMEVILWMLFVKMIIPEQMTFEGWNFDILVGITALLIGYLVHRKRASNRLLIAWNIAGLLILLNIVMIALLSAPLPLRAFMNEPANIVVAYFPFVWLPGFVVPVAYAMHIFSIKKALAE